MVTKIGRRIWDRDRDTWKAVRGSDRRHNRSTIRDFESGSLSSDWVGATGGWGVSTDSSLEGSNLLESSSTFAGITYEGFVTKRGWRYKFRYIDTDGSGGGQCWFFVGVQDAHSSAQGGVLQDSYGAELQVDNNTLNLFRWKSGSSTSLASASPTLSTSTEYRIVIDYPEKGQRFRVAVLNSSDSQLKEAFSSSPDDTFSGGYIGVYSDSKATDQIDFINQTRL